MKPYYQDSFATIFCGSCFELVPQIEIADHVITDPPYTQRTSENMRSRKDASDGGAYIGDNQRRRIDFDGVDGKEASLVELFLSKSRRWVLVFCALEQIGVYAAAARDCHVRSTAWHRTNPAPQFTGDRPGQVHEGAVLLHNKGRKAWNRGGHGLAWIGPTVNAVSDPDRGLGHPTPKPVWIMADCIDALTRYGDTILDPFMGSGTTLVAAKQLGRKSIGIELEEKYCEIAARRLQQEYLPLEIPKQPTIEQCDLIPNE
jgi:DNA modification methylase